MIYVCRKCGFVFTRVGNIDICPVCEQAHLRMANPEEERELEKTLLQKSKKSDEIEKQGS